MSSRAEFRFVVGTVVTLIALRSAVPLLMERSLDSDQAIVGLMAKHLSEFQTFPLFFYGQNYMLGVQSWLAVPFFWIGGPTVSMLRLPMLLINIGMVIGVITILVRLGMRPALAFVAALPLAVTTPIMSDSMLQALGAAVEPFAYVVALWGLRRRPLWFGLLFCVAVLHREFAIYTAPALALAQWRAQRFWTLRELGAAIAGVAAVWVCIDLLKRTINAYGPPGGEHAASSLATQPQQLAMWLSLDGYPSRVADLIMRGIPDMLGAHAHDLAKDYGLFSELTAGSTIAGTALALALAASVVGLVSRRSATAVGDEARRDAFSLYLGLIGVQAILGYGLNGGIDIHAEPIIRYALFVLFIPVAILSAFFLDERRTALRRAVTGLMCVWAAFTIVDAGRVIHEFVVSPPDQPHREVADYMVEHEIRYGRAIYWDAYVVSFLSRERAIVASTGKVRISKYQMLVQDNDASSVYLVRQPCEDGVAVAAWCLVPAHPR